LPGRLPLGAARCSEGTAQETAATAAAQGGDAAAGDADGKSGPPLTGEVKAKAEKAALAAYPGTVVKSEEDVENPGLYAAEVKKSDATTIEVYLDKSYKVVKTKAEGGEDTDG
jgi:hypothetical protein